jgi:hypothetical protein
MYKYACVFVHFVCISVKEFTLDGDRIILVHSFVLHAVPLAVQKHKRTLICYAIDKINGESFSSTHESLQFLNFSKSLHLAKTQQSDRSFGAWSKGLLEKEMIPEPVKEFPRHYGDRRLTAAFTVAVHLPCPQSISLIHPLPAYCSN